VRLAALFTVAGLVALGLQTTLARLLPFAELMPSLTVILTVELALRHQGIVPVILAFVIGYAADAFSGMQLGLNALIYTLIFLGARWFSRRVISSSMMVGMIAVFASVIFADVANYLVSSEFAWRRAALAPVIPLSILQAAVTALLAPAVFRVMQRAARRLHLRPRPAWQ
jgi:rod shape-determining protein MreD